MRSPETAMGMAGGQPTVGRPQTRPREWAASTVSRGAKAAWRMEQARSPRARGSWGGFASPGHCPRAAAAWANSSGVFSGVAISTRKSRSAYSHSTPWRRSCPASSWPVTPRGAATVTRKGSLGSTRQPAAVSLSRSSAKRSTASARRWG